MGDYTDILYCCGSDFLDKRKYFFNSIDKLKEKIHCWKDCGIVEVCMNENAEEIYHTWIEKGWYESNM